MENHTVIIAFFDQGNEIVHGIRRNVRIELGFDDAAVFHFNRNNRVAHIGYLLSIFKSIYRSSRKYESPRLAGGWFSLLFRMLVMIRTTIVTT